MLFNNMGKQKGGMYKYYIPALREAIKDLGEMGWWNEPQNKTIPGTKDTPPIQVLRDLLEDLNR